MVHLEEPGGAGPATPADALVKGIISPHTIAAK